jgi:hypothetical protein
MPKLRLRLGTIRNGRQETHESHEMRTVRHDAFLQKGHCWQMAPFQSCEIRDNDKIKGIFD